MKHTYSAARRKVIAAAALTAIAPFLVRSPAALATADDVKGVIDALAGGAELQTGKLTLTAPEIAENGNTVPVAVEVDSPMTDDAYVESVMILAEGNPIPDVVTFNFTPTSGLARASTRMRLAKTQNVVAVAKMSDGSIFTDTKNVKVTIGGCGG